jgi:hypothetical protein
MPVNLALQRELGQERSRPDHIICLGESDRLKYSRQGISFSLGYRRVPSTAPIGSDNELAKR